MTTYIWQIIVAGIMAMAIGFLWYSPVLFGKQWMKEMGITKESMAGQKKGMTSMYIISYIGAVITAFVLFKVFTLTSLGGHDASFPFKLAALLWLGFIATTILNTVTYEKKSWTLYFINAGYQLVTLLVMTFIFTIWA